MKRLIFILSFLLISWSVFSQAVTQTSFVGKFTFQSFSAGGTSDVTGILDAFSDQTNQYFANNILVGDVIWDNQGNRWEVMAVNSSNLLQADVDLRNINSVGGTPVGVGFVSRETPNMGLSLFVPDNNIGISQQLKSRIESHNMLLIDQYVTANQDSVFTGATAADTTTVSDPTIGDVLVADNGDVAYYDGDSWVVSASSGGPDNLGNHFMTQNLQTGGNWISLDGDQEGIFINNEGEVAINTVPENGVGINIQGAIKNDDVFIPGIGVKNDLIYLAPTENEVDDFWFTGFYVLLHAAEPTATGQNDNYCNGTLYIMPNDFDQDVYAVDIQTLVNSQQNSLHGSISIRSMDKKYTVSLVRANYNGNEYAAVYFSNPTNNGPANSGSFFSGIVKSTHSGGSIEPPMTIISADNGFVSSQIANSASISNQNIIAEDYAYENRFRRIHVGNDLSAGTATFDLAGDARFRAEIRDINNEAGTPGQILSTTGVGVDWIDAPSGGSSDGNGIYSGSGNVPDGTEASLADGGSFAIKDNSGNDRLRITEEANIAITGTTGFTATTTSGILGLTHTGSTGQLIVQSQDERATFQGEEARIIGDTLARMTVGTGQSLIKDALVNLTAGSSDFATLDGTINEFRVGTHDIVFEGTDGFYPEWKFQTPVAANDWRLWTGAVGLTLQNGTGGNTIVIENDADPAMTINADGEVALTQYDQLRHDTDNAFGNYSVDANGQFLKTYDGEFNYRDDGVNTATNTSTVIMNNGSMQLPTAVGNAGKMFIVIANASTDGGTTRSISVAGGGTIEGNATLTMDAAYEVYALISTGTEYVILWNKP